MSILIPSSFEALFLKYMKKKDVTEFKRTYSTLYNRVIKPIEVERDQLFEACAGQNIQVVKMATAHHEACQEWERLMMELVGEDGPGSVRTAIEKIKLESDAHLAEAMELKEKLAQAQAEIQAASMSKRDQFIAAAFQGLLAHPFTRQWSADKMAESTLKRTDALLAEIEKRNQ